MGAQDRPGRFLCASRVTRYASLLLIATLIGCAVPQVPSRIVYEDPANFVRVETDPWVLPDRPETSHDHPATLDAGLMVDILKGLSVRAHRLAVHVWLFGEAEVAPAFTESEITLLAPKLSEALARATPQERVTFYLSYPQTSVKREVTSGGLYVQGGRLHFTVSNHRDVYGIPTYGMVYDRRYPALPIVPKDFDVLFEPSAAVVPQAFSLWNAMWGLERDGVIIDLNRLPAAQSVVWSLP